MVKQSPTSQETINIRAKRIRRLREYLGISRQKFAAKHIDLSLNANSLLNWELGKWGGLTENGATLLTEAFNKEGLKVTVPWLMFGMGEDPISGNEFQSRKPISSYLNEIPQDPEFFRSDKQDTVELIISDDALEPCLKPGDYVAGICYRGNDMEKAIGHFCIVHIDNQTQIVRKVNAGSDLGLYTLTCTNPNTLIKETKIENISLISATPILWIKKPEIKK